MKKIYIGSDHAGFELKEKIKKWLDKKGYPYQDLGNKVLDPLDDYPDYAAKVARAVARNKSLGILACGSAQGVCIAANKIRGARAAIPHSLKEARLARFHDDANIICLSGWFHHYHRAMKMVEIFLSTKFSSEPKRIRRLNKVIRLER